MTQPRSARLGVLAAVLAAYAALGATWIMLLSFGLSGGAAPDAAAAAEPLLLIVLAAVVLGTLAYGRASTATVATIELAAGAVGFAGVARLTLDSDFWGGPIILLFATPPALFFAAGVWALGDFLRARPRPADAVLSWRRDADSSAEQTP